MRNSPCVHLYAYTILLNVRLIFFLRFNLRSCHVTFHSSFIIQSYVRQFNILTNHDQTTALGVYSALKSTLVTDWSIENMNSDMTPKQDVAICQCITKRKKKHVQGWRQMDYTKKSACQTQLFLELQIHSTILIKLMTCAWDKGQICLFWSFFKRSCNRFC